MFLEFSQVVDMAVSFYNRFRGWIGLLEGFYISVCVRVLLACVQIIMHSSNSYNILLTNCIVKVIRVFHDRIATPFFRYFSAEEV